MAKVIVCEDDGEILTIIRILLEDLGLEVITAKSLKGFTDKIKQNKADIVILDYWIKNTRADVLVKNLKADNHYKDKPIILISATTDLKNIGGRLGVDETIAKPFDIDDFQAKIKQYI